MNSRPLARIAVTAISLLALAAPGMAQAAADSAPKDPCWRYQATVNRHQDRLDSLNAEIDPVAKKIEQLEHEYEGASGEADYWHTVSYEARAWVSYLESDDSGEFSAADYAQAVKERDKAVAEYEKAVAAEKKASEALREVKQDPKLIEERAKTQKLLARAEKALARCEAKPAA
ncbi:hypothetical protein ACFQVC_28855 [Streptomyces monticola]|uniref:Uncharacterized protein n=1 Tax=Streptomyces monticola TaxID=2666263 RepID=A0ABW2JQK3_9ACTN